MFEKFTDKARRVVVLAQEEARKAAAEKATAKMALAAANFFNRDQGFDARPAQYVVFYNEAWGRWVGAINMSELIQRSTSTGGYLGFCEGFYTF
jgi:hypothetical protein